MIIIPTPAQIQMISFEVKVCHKDGMYVRIIIAHMKIGIRKFQNMQPLDYPD